VVAEAKRELQSAERTLEAARAKLQDRHPDVIDAREKVAAAQQRVRRAEAEVPPDEPDDEVIVAPTSDAARAALEKELAELESRLARVRAQDKAGAAAGSAAAATADDAATNWVVERETEYAELRLAVDEKRERVQTLSDSVARAQIDAGIQMAEQGSRLTVVDPAFLPSKPFGKGPKLLIIAGVMVFLGLGMVLAMGLAILDDRLYRRADIDELALAPVLAVIPGGKAGKRGKPSGGSAARSKRRSRAGTEVL
jgi:succinoglycan biosynthesis transport protein ExoP